LPPTPLLSVDKSHNSYYWTSDIAKAIAQVETYIESVASQKANIIVQIEKITGLRLKIMKPPGIIIAGSTGEFAGVPVKADYFRMLNEGLKNVEVMPYDDLSRRLRNMLVSIERLSGSKRRAAKKKKRRS
jgi:hypothetical protein